MPGQPSNLEEGFFPVIWAQLPKKGFNIDPPSVKLFFQNRNQGGYGNPSISNLTQTHRLTLNPFSFISGTFWMLAWTLLDFISGTS